MVEILDYDAESGAFRWRVNRAGGAKAGDVAGYVSKQGYRQIMIKGWPHRAHRLAFLIMTGEWPAQVIDHLNGIKDDNRFSNLRAVSNEINAQNQRNARQDSRSGILGVSPARAGRYQATIQVGGKTRHLGYFDSPEVAHQMYLAAKRMLHPGNTL